MCASWCGCFTNIQPNLSQLSPVTSTPSVQYNTDNIWENVWIQKLLIPVLSGHTHKLPPGCISRFYPSEKLKRCFMFKPPSPLLCKGGIFSYYQWLSLLVNHRHTFSSHGSGDGRVCMCACVHCIVLFSIFLYILWYLLALSAVAQKIHFQARLENGSSILISSLRSTFLISPSTRLHAKALQVSSQTLLGHNKVLGSLETLYDKLMSFANQSAVCGCAITAH